MSNTPNVGTYRQQPEDFRAFIPGPFPVPAMLDITPQLAKKHDEATRLVGKLDGITQLLPDKDYFLRMFIAKDASSSSQIEGTKATMMDAVGAESKERSTGLPDDVDDILHYIDAVSYGLKRADSLPLSLRFIAELHGKLMAGARQTHPAHPGEFRRSQNWIGGTRPSNAHFVPPPVTEMKQALGDLEKFMRAEDNYLPLIKAGLLHAQFETIHPFNDGNGRSGRMLVTMYVWHVKLLEVPVLYLSTYFKKHQKVYYERLDNYHAEPSQIEEWLDFFLDGVIAMATSAIDTCKKITQLREDDMRKAQGQGKTAAKVTINVLRHLFGQPIVSAADIAEWTGYSRQGSYNVISRLSKLGILSPLRGSEVYGQKYVYWNYFKLFYDEE